MVGEPVDQVRQNGEQGLEIVRDGEGMTRFFIWNCISVNTEITEQKSKASTSKLQAPEKLQISSANVHPGAKFGFWRLRVLWNLEPSGWRSLDWLPLTVLAGLAVSVRRTLPG